MPQQATKLAAASFRQPSIACRSNGTCVAAYVDDDGIYFHTVNVGGVTLPPIVLTTSGPALPALAVSGDLVVAIWQGRIPEALTQVSYTVLSPGGAPGEPTLVAPNSGTEQTAPAIACNATKCVAVWLDYSGPTAQLMEIDIDPGGSVTGEGSALTPVGPGGPPSVTAADNSFLVTWSSTAEAPSVMALFSSGRSVPTALAGDVMGLVPFVGMTRGSGWIAAFVDVSSGLLQSEGIDPSGAPAGVPSALLGEWTLDLASSYDAASDAFLLAALTAPGCTNGTCHPLGGDGEPPGLDGRCLDWPRQGHSHLVSIAGICTFCGDHGAICCPAPDGCYEGAACSLGNCQ
jgi:hypothetical protein